MKTGERTTHARTPRQVLRGTTLWLLLAALIPAIALAVPGALTFVELDVDGGGNSGLDSPRGDGGISANGQNVYLTSLNGSTISTWTRNTASGALSFLEVDAEGGAIDGLAGAHSATVAPDGENVYVAALSDNAVSTFTRDTTTGALTFLEADKDGAGTIDGLANARALAVSPDNKHVYVVGAVDNAVATFSRDDTTGALTFVEFDKDGAGTVDGLAGAEAVALPPDGRHVYVAGQVDDAVATFSRDETTGALTFVEFDKDDAVGVDGLNGAVGIFPSPDNKHVYVVGRHDDAVATFSRDATTGALTFVEFDKDGVGPVDALDGAASVEGSLDGKNVYVVGPTDDAVTTFSRDAATGALTFVEVDRDGVDGANGLDEAVSVIASPDGKHVYTTSDPDNAVVTFAREQEPVPPVPDPEPPVPGPDPAADPATACKGAVATIKGTKKSDKLVGTAGPDVIVAGPGSDKINGGAGNDVICGGSGNDKVAGGEGNDALNGGLGNDRQDGGAGDDRLLGAAGNDKSIGGPGNDALGGGSGKNDKCTGGDGTDTVTKGCDKTSTVP